LRIVCLPDATTVFALRSPELDWRRTRNIDIEKIDTDSVVAEPCGSLLRRLTLTMGIIDAKVVGDDIYFGDQSAGSIPVSGGAEQHQPQKRLCRLLSAGAVMSISGREQTRLLGRRR
jgi:hypothetical protein